MDTEVLGKTVPCSVLRLATRRGRRVETLIDAEMEILSLEGCVKGCSEVLVCWTE